MPEKNEWETKAANILKAQLKLKGVSYAQLAELIGDKEPSVRNKLSRGKFSAAFLIHSLTSIGVHELRI
jgi:lambda repressor-like predicted transcriptional regulator